MAKKIEIPEFKSEAEEADWWPANQDAFLSAFEEAAKNGTVKRGGIAQSGQTPTTTIRLDLKDIELAKVQAEERGLKYQTYLKMLIHQALQVEAKKRARR